ncbi:VCBS repeat-containing protein [Paraglaciecola aquimarina]|uniref:VCBS repeat-containing protein n=1 Tax=Paraglaciecola algarum TaxID=3050085 RepID=A0ABS9D6N8_9ALTE|nr:VCBS repeat-containing protein [Paraglaciecola sp. G1-23]MCF2948584.1 VCBS repeat-containing protein [Paraglaciecola sp. G1-23]
MLRKRLLFMGLILSSNAFWSEAKYTELFTEQKVALPFSVNRSVVAADVLLQAGVELLVSGVDDNQQRKLAILGLNTTTASFEVLDVIDIANNVFAFDVGVEDQQGLKQLYLLTKSSVTKYIPARMSHGSSWQLAQQVSSMYISEISDAFGQMDFVRDINDDKKDDIILPHFETLNLWLSNCCSQKHSQVLPIASRMEMRNSSVTFDDRELFFQDMTQDAKTDLVLVEDGRLFVYQQNADIQFSLQPIEINIHPKASGLEWWDTKDEKGQELNQSNLIHRKVDAIEDVNGDNIPDVAIKYTQSSGVLDKKINYEFYYGKVIDNRLSYATQADTQVASTDTLTGLYFVDLQDDGKLEVVVSSFDIGISQVIGALMSGSIDQDTLIFAMDEEFQFSPKPIVSQEVEMTFSLSSGSTGQPLTKVIDLNADGLKDIVYSDGTDKIKVLYAESNGKRSFVRRALTQKVKLPSDSEGVAAQDLNGDGKTDLAFRFGRGDAPELLNQVTVLVAN